MGAAKRGVGLCPHTIITQVEKCGPVETIHFQHVTRFMSQVCEELGDDAKSDIKKNNSNVFVMSRKEILPLRIGKFRKITARPVFDLALSLVLNSQSVP